MRTSVGQLRHYISAVVLLAVTACGSEVPRWWDAPPTGTPASPSPLPPPSTEITILNVSTDVPGLNGGGGTGAVVRANADAPPGGAEIRLTSSSPAVQVPGIVRIPPGTRTASFSVATQGVAQDLTAEIVASIGPATGRATLAVWAILPTSFWWISEPEDTLWRGRFGRHTPGDGTRFVARCERNELMVQITPPGAASTSIEMAAPATLPLRVGTYEGAMRFSGPGVPGLDVGINQTGCNTSRGRFVVSEADFSATGEVRRFVGTFEHYCTNSPTPVRGELRLTGPFQMPPFAVTCQQ